MEYHWRTYGLCSVSYNRERACKIRSRSTTSTQTSLPIRWLLRKPAKNVPGLLRTLETDTSGVDRKGAAQGLSEVLSGLGMERLEGLLPDIIANSRSPRPTVREGFMSLLVFLPATFGSRFQPHLPKIIPPILGGLSDTEEYVREAAMRAGRMVVTNYSSKAIDLLLPELENGIFEPNWRIRVGAKFAHLCSFSAGSTDGARSNVAINYFSRLRVRLH